MTQLDDVKSRLDIVDLVGGYVQLQRSGGSFKANCPFHQERTPSFFVFPDRQSWRCFGACAEGGDAFSFVMKHDRLDFREALVQLGARVGVTITDQADTGDRTRLLFEINDAARQFFQRMLAEPEAAFVREYLHNRGVNERSLQTFEFGYSPARDNRLLTQLTAAGYTPQDITEAGLARQTDDGRHYDLFRGRLMIPIRDWSARVAGFGSRALADNATPKYLNTHRTPVFDKSRILYAMHLAKEPVRQHGAVIVEGYMDAVMAHQHGFDNVVASMGTALTEHQVSLVRRLTHRVTMALDGDPAGRNATLRSLESSWDVFQQRERRATQRERVSVLQQPESVDLRIAELPSGKDPDDYIRESPGNWTDFVAGAIPLFEYLLAASSLRLDSEADRSRAARTMLRFVASIPDPIQHSIYVDQLSARLSVNSGVLTTVLQEEQQKLAAERRGRRTPNTADEATPQPKAGNVVEELVVAISLQYRDELVPHDFEPIPLEWFSQPENREIYRTVLSRTEPDTGGDIPVPSELEPHFEELSNRELNLPTMTMVKKAWEQSRSRMAKEHANQLAIQLPQTIQSEEFFETEAPGVDRWQNVSNRRREIDMQLQPASPHHK